MGAHLRRRRDLSQLQAATCAITLPPPPSSMSGRSGYTDDGGASMMSWLRDDEASYASSQRIPSDLDEYEEESIDQDNKEHMEYLDLEYQYLVNRLQEDEVICFCCEKMAAEKMQLEIDLAGQDVQLEVMDEQVAELKKKIEVLKEELDEKNRLLVISVVIAFISVMVFA